MTGTSTGLTERRNIERPINRLADTDADRSRTNIAVRRLLRRW